MKNIISTLVVLSVIALVAYNQKKKELDLLITIDDKVIIDEIMHVKLTSINNLSLQSITPVKYYPGRLEVPESVLNSIPDTASISLSFDYYDNSSNLNSVRNIKIDLQKQWLMGPYLILKIFDLSREKYKGVFAPLSPEQNYTFSIFSPDYYFERKPKRKLNQ